MSSGFITETEVLEERRRRQEEWDKVRTDDQPKEVPDEPYDTRPLFQRLEEQRLKKEAEYEETHKLKNMIRGLDDDEVGFLDLVERTKAEAAHQISLIEQKEMQEFRERVSSLAEQEERERLRAQVAAPVRTTTSNNTQKDKLKGLIVRKRKASDVEDEKPPIKQNGVTSTSASSPTTPVVAGGATVCIGVLPGVGQYDTDSTSDSDSSTDREDCCPKRDLLGRLPEEKKEVVDK